MSFVYETRDELSEPELEDIDELEEARRLAEFRDLGGSAGTGQDFRFRRLGASCNIDREDPYA